MKLTYEKKEEMTFIGFHTEIKPGEGCIKCPEFRDREYNDRYAHLWQEWFPSMDGETTVRANLEVYSDGDPNSPDYECGIRVPVKNS